MADLINKVILGVTSDVGPALVSHQDRLYLAWKGSGNDNLNIMFSNDDGRTFQGKQTFNEFSDHAPALASTGDVLFLAWKGSGNDNLNVAQVGPSGLEKKVILGETSSAGPALVAEGSLFLAWKGSGNDNLNIMSSDDDGASFPDKHTFNEFSDHAPAITRLEFLAWKGSGNENLNVASFSGGSILDKVILGETSDSGPALELFMNQGANELLFLAWKGSGNDQLNTIFSHRRALNFTGKLTYGDSSDTTPALASHHDRLFIAWKGSGNPNLSVAQVPVS